MGWWGEVLQAARPEALRFSCPSLPTQACRSGLTSTLASNPDLDFSV